MTAETPNYGAHADLSALASRYVDVAALDWRPAGHPGCDWKILFQDKERGLMTALFPARGIGGNCTLSTTLPRSRSTMLIDSPPMLPTYSVVRSVPSAISIRARAGSAKTDPRAAISASPSTPSR